MGNLKKVYFLSEGQTNQVHIMARTQFFTGNLDGMSTAVQLCIIGTVGKIQKYQISYAHPNNCKMAKTLSTAREALLSSVVNWLVCLNMIICSNCSKIASFKNLDSIVYNYFQPNFTLRLNLSTPIGWKWSHDLKQQIRMLEFQV